MAEEEDSYLDKTEVKIAVLSENYTGMRGVLAEHGLALYIEKGMSTVLFDTGQSDIFYRNAAKLGLSLKNLASVFISHGHYDHTGGLLPILQNTNAQVYAHPDIFITRYSTHHGKIYSIGIPTTETELKKRGLLRQIHLNRKTIDVGDFSLTGEIPKTCPFEEPASHFWLDRDRKNRDGLLDDQALFMRTRKGLLVFLGCCHSGLVNTLSHILYLTGEKRFHWIIGGTHLLHASEERLRKTSEELEKIDFDLISPLHCTGLRGQCFFQIHFKERYRQLSCGDVVYV